ncbi:putative ribonuclease H-like domain-containing protein [Tanacetum coccineum]|uniref:Ribonuclease H-like domain-containing protein n=1 Tax=Tanacetum coccineum TaxID=301880 RepID=A0ABQ5IQJ6_9ASTR
MCDKKNSVLFTETECHILSIDFKLLDESQVLLRVPRQNNMYSFDLKNVVPTGGLTCLFAKATIDESNLWHMRLGHINFKTMNKLVRGNLVRDLTSKLFVNGQTCVSCQKGKQLKASCKTKTVSSICKPLQLLHMDLFGPVSMKSINKKSYCLVVTDDFSRFSWVFFLATKDETPEILKNFITGIENQTDHKVKTIRCDNGTEFKNRIMNEFCEIKGRKPALSFMRPFGCPVTILNTLDHLGNKTNGNACTKANIDEGQGGMKTVPGLQYVLLPFLTSDSQNTGIFSGAYDDEDVGAEADLNNLETTMNKRTNHKDYQNCLFACFLSQKEPKKVIQALDDPSWIEEMQEELLQFTLQKVRTLVDLPNGKRAIGTKWAFRNKKDERGIVVRNKARLVGQGYTQEKGVIMMRSFRVVLLGKRYVYLSTYHEVFAPVARIEAIRLFFAYASFMGFIVYQMDVKSAFLYGTIEEEVYVCQPPGFEDPQFPDKVYKVEKALYGLHQAPRAWYETLSTYLLENRFRRGTIDKTLFIKKDKDDAQEILDEFYGGAHFLLRVAASTLIETNKALLKDKEAEDVDVHLYRSMIRSLMYLIASRSDIMFVVCAYARFQVTPKVSHLHAVNRIFRYLKGKPKLGLWYPRDSSFDLEAFSDSDYDGTSLDRKSITGGCQFFGKRLISWQCKNQTIVAHSTTEVEYVAATNCCGQVLWIQNQMLDYGFNFMNTKIHIDNESTICIMKNPVFHAKTKHIEIRHHFIGDSYKKRLIQFWNIAHSQTVNDVKQIHATVDDKTLVISESSVRSDLHFNDEDGITCLTNDAIFENLILMGYESDSNKLTFQKALFSPQWKYLIHTILHCLSSKSTFWNEFSTNIASAVICLANGQKFNFSKLIFDDTLAEPFNEVYQTPAHTKKVFTNMKRKGKDFSGRVTPLFTSMLAPPVIESKGLG